MMTLRDREEMRTKAEQDIQKILLDLVNKSRTEIENVRVDTRRYANLTVEIFFRGEA